MSARPFWVLFTICIIVLIQWLIVPGVIDIVLSKEILSIGVPMKEVDIILDEREIPLTPALRTRIAESPEDIIGKDDLRRLGFRAKYAIISDREPMQAASYVIGLFVTGILAGFLFASVAFRQLVRFGDRLGGLSTTDKISIFLGLLVGVMLSVVLLPGVMSLLRLPRNPAAITISALIIMYLCVMALMNMKEELRFYFPGAAREGEPNKALQKPKILDTNVIIDGRIADVCRTGFVEGRIYIPSFILEELQHIADSSDGLRRARGRRGLDILNQMRKELDLNVRQSDPVNAENDEEVDTRLVKLAKEIDGAIVTNDFNLNKVAQLQGVDVLNINELANALKPVVLPGEEVTVSINKEGKESNQGVAYLDDGTMVVVEGAKSYIGSTVDAVVTSVLQTVAGKMIFANLKAVQDEEDDLIGRNVRSYSSFRPRKKIK